MGTAPQGRGLEKPFAGFRRSFPLSNPQPASELGAPEALCPTRAGGLGRDPTSKPRDPQGGGVGALVNHRAQGGQADRRAAEASDRDEEWDTKLEKLAEGRPLDSATAHSRGHRGWP